MRTLIIVVALFIGFSCKKPAVEFEKLVPTIEKDPNLVVSYFKAYQQGNLITINFTTSVENNLKEIILMHGSNSTQFCMVKAVQPKGTGNLQNYQLTDDAPQGETTYYILKYTTKSGDWGCSELFSSAKGQ